MPIVEDISSTSSHSCVSMTTRNQQSRRHTGTFVAIGIFGLALSCNAFPFMDSRGQSTTPRSLSVRKMTSTDLSPFVKPPYLAIITEPDACATSEKTEATFDAIVNATSTGRIDVVSIRLEDTAGDPEESVRSVRERALDLTRRLVCLADDTATSSTATNRIPQFLVVCSSDLENLAVEANAHGVHVKESHLSQIPTIRQAARRDDFVIGTSTHSISSAIESYNFYHPDYYFVGTCFLTESHPEKSKEKLEGPSLPGEVRRALSQETEKSCKLCPAVFGIGGIDENNCSIPISEGADGVAVIRAVLQATNPSQVTACMHTRMLSAVSVR